MSAQLFPSSDKKSAHVRNLFFWEKNAGFIAGSVVLITGGGSGIARQVARVYATRGAKLVLCDMNAAALAEAVDECRKIAAESKKPSPNPAVLKTLVDGASLSAEARTAFLEDASSDILGIVTDVTKEDECARFVDLAVARFGRIDILLLCAGIGAHNVFTRTDDMRLFHKCMDVNFYGYLYCTHAAFKHLVKSRGVLTAITSFSGEVGLPYRTAYCASKFAVTGFLEALRAEMLELGGQPAFDICLVCPPTTNTNLRANSLTTDKKLKTEGAADDEKSMTVEDCASCVIDATDRRLRKAFFPWTSTVASYLRPLVPDVIDKKIHAKARL